MYARIYCTDKAKSDQLDSDFHTYSTMMIARDNLYQKSGPTDSVFGRNKLRKALCIRAIVYTRFVRGLTSRCLGKTRTHSPSRPLPARVVRLPHGSVSPATHL